LLEGQVGNMVIADNMTAGSSKDYLHRRSPADLEPHRFDDGPGRAQAQPKVKE
jgi:hypothetical protein